MKIKNSKIYKIIMYFTNHLKDDNVPVHASSTAFFLFLSLAPMLLIMCALITYTPYSAKEIVKVMSDFVPKAFIPYLEVLIDQMYYKTGSILSIATIVAVWSSSKAMAALQSGLNSIKKVHETRSFIIIRLQSCFYTLIVLIFFIINLFLASIGKGILEGLRALMPTASGVIEFFVANRMLFGWIIFTFVFALIFTFVPNLKGNFKREIPGAAFAAIGWELYSLIYSACIKFFNTSKAYGSLSIIILIMIWLYFGVYLLLIGAEINRFFAKDIGRCLNMLKKKLKKQS